MRIHGGGPHVITAGASAQQYIHRPQDTAPQPGQPRPIATSDEVVDPISYAFSCGYGEGWDAGHTAGYAEAERAAVVRTRIHECPDCGRREYRQRPPRTGQPAGSAVLA